MFFLRVTTIAAVLLIAGTASAQGVGAPLADRGDCGPSRPGCHLTEDGQWRRVADGHPGLSPREPDHWQTGLEMALLLGGGTAWYVIDDRNVADWDFESWEQRLTWDAFAYDNNSFDINFIWHPLSGAAFHAVSRANGQSLAGAVAYGLLTSAAWELIIEFKEKTSVNDLIVTTGAGIPIGEFVHKLALDLQDEGAAARWTAGLPVALHDAIDGREPPAVDFWRRIHLSYGVATTRVDGAAGSLLHSVILDGRIGSIPGYLGPGRFERFFTAGDVVSLRTRVTAGTEGTGLDLSSDVTLLGLHRQSIASGGGGLHGEAVTAGASLAFRYRNEDYGIWRDQLSITGLPGPALDTHVFAGPLEVRLLGRLHAAFAGIHAEGFDRWAEAHPDQRPKSILLKQGYYYGWGWWARIGMELRAWTVSVGASLAYGSFDSHEGLDRTQDAVTADLDADDVALDWHLWSRWTPLGNGPFLEARAAGQHRRSQLAGLESDRGFERFGVHAGWTW